MNKSCIIAAVGKGSLHRQWLNKTHPNVDLHLIVYDDSYESYKADTPYIIKGSGCKFSLINGYITDDIIDKYDYFYMPDDDISIDWTNIVRLFMVMKKYNLSIAQPALSNSSHSYPHTLRKENSEIRFTNFVEIMQPCFSREALKKVKFTFGETENGWGIDFHWGILLDFRKFTMAILDDVISEHTRDVKSKYQEELNEYLIKYKLSCDIYST